MKKLLIAVLLVLAMTGVGWGQENVHSRTFAPYLTLGRTTPGTTTDALYNPAGVLTYSGTAVALASSNVASATKLATARAINGVNFDGTAAIQVPTGTGTTVSSSGTNTVSVTAANNAQTFVAGGTATNTYNLPTGDLSANIGTTITPLTYRFVKANANTLTIAPGTGNFIANGGAGKTLYYNVAGETNNTITLQLVSSAASVNTWAIVGAHGTWVSTP